jgi:hypothetical protein
VIVPSDCTALEYCVVLQQLTLRLTGVPNLILMKGMKAEHCSRKDSRKNLKTSIYSIETCPLKEWNLVFSENSEYFMGTKDAVKTVLSKATKEGKMKDSRRIPLLNELKNLDVV